MWHSDYQFYAALEAHTGGHITDVRLCVDWIPALRWAEFEQSLIGGHAQRGGSAPPVIEPLWSEAVREPYLRGVRILTAYADAAVDFPLSYFTDAVSSASAQLVGAGTLAPGQKFEYRVFALPDRGERGHIVPSYNIVAVDEAPDIGRGDLFHLTQQADRVCPVEATPELPPDEPMPIFIPQALLEEVAELARGVGDIETGGILLGKLWRDPNGKLFSKVTAQIRADHTEATQTSLRFTPQTWVSVNAAIGLRGMHEIPLGWWHSHPFFCRNCPSEKRACCPFSVPAFSGADRHLHREVFQKAWNIALLVSFLGKAQPSYDVFTWNRGQIAAAGFYSLQGSSDV